MAKKLTPEVIERLKLRKDIKMKICQEFGMDQEAGLQSVRRWIRMNETNGKMTCKSVLRILSRELKLTENQILEDVGHETIKIRKGNPNPVEAG